MSQTCHRDCTGTRIDRQGGKVTFVELKALAVGLTVGLLFQRLGLPIPAPTALAGVLGIIGIYLGYRLGQALP